MQNQGGGCYLKSLTAHYTDYLNETNKLRSDCSEFWRQAEKAGRDLRTAACLFSLLCLFRLIFSLQRTFPAQGRRFQTHQHNRRNKYGSKKGTTLKHSVHQQRFFPTFQYLFLKSNYCILPRKNTERLL